MKYTALLAPGKNKKDPRISAVGSIGRQLTSGLTTHHPAHSRRLHLRQSEPGVPSKTCSPRLARHNRSECYPDRTRHLSPKPAYRGHHY